MDSEDINAWWDSLSEEEREKAFLAVTSKIYDAEVLNESTYRYVIYDVFGFGPSMYRKGLYSGYFTIHNLIVDGLEAQDKEFSDAMRSPL